MSRSIDPRILRGMERQLQLRQERLGAGERSIGWKAGFGAPASLARLQLQAPLIGFLTDRVLLEAGSTVSTAGWTRPAVEPEIAVYLGEDLRGSADRESVRNAIAAVGPALELADVHFPPEEVETILAGNIYNRHVILGRADPSRRGCRLDGLTAFVSRNAEELAPVTELQALTGDILGIVAHAARLLDALGETLRAGEVILAGSIISPLWVEASEEIRYTLGTVDSIAVALA